MNFKKPNKYALLLVTLFFPVLCCAQTEKELVIEMQGDPVPAYRPSNLSIWDKNTSQLLKMLRGKTRPQVLYDVPHVSSKDRVVKNKNTSYSVVEYIQGDDFRKFLFQGQEPQTFITAATTVQDVLAINKKYGINMGLAQKAFEQAYDSQYTAEKIENMPTHTVLYTLSYTDVNTPTAQPLWLLFELKQLTQIFYTQTDKEAYVKSLLPPAQPPAQTPKKPTPKKTVRKALVSGGTVWDQIYMPRLVTSPSKDENSSTK